MIFLENFGFVEPAQTDLLSAMLFFGRWPFLTAMDLLAIPDEAPATLSPTSRLHWTRQQLSQRAAVRDQQQPVVGDHEVPEGRFRVRSESASSASSAASAVSRELFRAAFGPDDDRAAGAALLESYEPAVHAPLIPTSLPHDPEMDGPALRELAAGMCRAREVAAQVPRRERRTGRDSYYLSNRVFV